MTNEIQPVSPRGVAEHKLANLPPVVIKIVNDLLSAACDGKNGIYHATVKKDDIVTRIKQELGDTFMGKPINDAIKEGGWLNFEPIFEKAGWKVEYHSPDYTESFPSYYKFRTNTDYNPR